MKHNVDKVKIIWLHSHFLYWMGGTKYVYEVIKRLKENYEILVVVEDSSDIANNYYKKIGVPLISMKRPTSTSSIYWLTLPLQIKSEANFIKNQLKDKGYTKKNTIIVTSMFPMNVIAQKLNFKSVQYCFEPFAFFYDNEFTKKFSFTKKMFIELLKILYKDWDIKATRFAKKIITLNNTTSSLVENIYRVKPAISYAGIDSEHFKPYVSRKLFEKYKNKKIIIHSTDYSPVKNTDLMFEIFAMVKSKEKNVHLLITSTIKNKIEEDKLKVLAKDLGIYKNIEFLGFVDYSLLPQYYSLAKVLVQTSFSEKSGTTSMALPVKEAMACGTPAIRFPVKNEDVVDGENGFFVDPRNKEKTTEKILFILNLDKAKYSKFAKAARNSIIHKYKWKNTARIIANTIEKVHTGK